MLEPDEKEKKKLEEAANSYLKVVRSNLLVVLETAWLIGHAQGVVDERKRVNDEYYRRMGSRESSI